MSTTGRAGFLKRLKRSYRAFCDAISLETRLLFAFVVAFFVLTIGVFLTDVWYDVHFLK